MGAGSGDHWLVVRGLLMWKQEEQSQRVTGESEWGLQAAVVTRIQQETMET